MTHSRYKEDIIYLSDIDNKILDLIGAAEAMCYISLLEGFGLPVLEAMACGVPVITSQKSAMEEVCGDAAVYVDPLDVDKIAEAMKKITSAGQYDHYSQLGLKRSQVFRWEKSARQIEELLKLTVRSISQ